MKRTITLAALYLAHALASPTSITGLQRRDDPSNVKNLPDNDKDCNGRTHSSDDIKTAISFAWNAVKNGNTYRESTTCPRDNEKNKKQTQNFWRIRTASINLDCDI